MRVAVIGSGISGIATSAVLKRCGHTPVLFERSSQIGGIWATAYPQVRLQNSASQYHLADFPWPFAPDLHPSAAQICRYLGAAVDHFGLEVRLRHEVVGLRQEGDAWRVDTEAPTGKGTEIFPQIVVAAGQYGGEQTSLHLEGRERFHGEVVTERDIHDHARFEGRRVAVVGFGKTAVDLAVFAAARGAEVHHVFRTPRWLLPRRILGVHFTYPLFARLSTAMMPSWSHGNAAERRLHQSAGWLVRGFWKTLSMLFAGLRGSAGIRAGAAARRRLSLLAPHHSLVSDLRSAIALAPDDYFRWVAEGRIQPHCAELSRLTSGGLALKDDAELPCDLVVLALGSKSPVFPYFEPAVRTLLEEHQDGLQLYRHVLHPTLSRVAFAGFNHSLLHVPSVEVAALWLCALWRGDLALPARAVMEREIEEVRAWKRAHIQFEPSRSCAVSTRFQQYLDLMLCDLGLSPYRKMPNLFAELACRYGPLDYAGLVEEYDRARETLPTGRLPLPFAG